MRKVFTALSLCVIGLSGGLPLMAAGVPFSIDCPLEFEDDLEGWKIDGTQISRNTGSWFGVDAQTPDYLLGGSNATSADVIYSPVKSLVAGEPCTIEFQFNSPGGSPANLFHYGATKVLVCSSQSLDSKVKELGNVGNAATTGWKKCSFTFTPEEAGDYCFAIQIQPYSDPMAYKCGNVFLDSFFIDGTEAVTVVEPKGTPFEKNYSFDDDADFPGVNVLPKGWASTGVKKFRRYSAETLGLPTPPSGDKVLGVISAQGKQDNNLMTEFYTLEGGIASTFKFSFFAASESGAKEIGYGFNVYASPTHELNQETAILIGTVADDYERPREWFESETFEFTPTEDGRYCFIIAPYTPGGYNPGGAVAFDDVVVTGSEVTLAPPPVEVPKGNPEAFTIDCPLEFDEDLEGWKIEGTALTRGKGADFGVAAQTPEYLLYGKVVLGGNVIYSPRKSLVAGEPCSLEFYVQTAGGREELISQFNYNPTQVIVCSDQDLSTKVEVLGNPIAGLHQNWKKCTYTFTPAEDGDYCFAIQVLSSADNLPSASSYLGYLAFDSFIIEGTQYGEAGGNVDDPIELDPNPDHLADCKDLPYLEDFNGGNYDGTSYLPIGWSTTGTVTWVTSSHNLVPAVEGDYYMVAPHNTQAERDDRAYTPFFNLEAGKTYTVEYHAYVQGNRWNDFDILYLPTLRLTVGTEQEADFHNTLDSFSEECETWVPRSVTFTPEKSGAYCFAFMLSGPVNSGYVFVDALKITGEGLVARVEPSFMVKSIVSMSDDTLTMGFKDEPVQFVNTSKYAESYKWTVEGAEPSTSTEANPSFVFPSDGEYTVLLEATNAKGTRKTQRKLNVQLIHDKYQAPLVLSVFNANQDRLYSAGQTPAFDSDPEADFVTGYNHYYFDLAQRYDFGEQTDLYLEQLSLTVTNRKYRNMTSYLDDQRIKPFSLVVYGADENGNLDESKVFGRLDSNIGEVLGSTGIYNTDTRDISLGEKPIQVSGTVYVAMHFDRGMEVIPQDENFGRSFISTQCVRHGHGVTTLYCKPFDKPEASDATLNEWCTIDNLDSRMKGIGAYWILWAKTKKGITGLQAIGADGQVVFAARFVGNELNVSGTAEGETVNVYTLNGTLVASAPAVEGATLLTLELPADIYIVKSGEKTAKVVK